MPARTDHHVPVSPPALLELMRTWRTVHLQATFAEIEIDAMHQVAALQVELIAVALETAPDGAPACPGCGRAMARNGSRMGTLVSSHAEPVTLTGSRYRCSACVTELPPRSDGGLGIERLFAVAPGRCASAPIAPLPRRRRCSRTSPA